MYQIHSDFHIIVNVGLVKMWFINGKAFTFEEIDNPSIELKEECQNKLQYTMDDMYRISQYLIMEELHPIVFAMDDYCTGEIPL